MSREENIERIKKGKNAQLIGNAEYWKERDVILTDKVQPSAGLKNVTFEGKGREKKRIVTKESIYTSWDVIDALSEVGVKTFKKLNKIYKRK